jgi:hypothetical protein
MWNLKLSLGSMWTPRNLTAGISEEFVIRVKLLMRVGSDSEGLLLLQVRIGSKSKDLLEKIMKFVLVG